MTDRRVDLALTTGNNDGTTWEHAYQGNAGLVVGYAASAAGDNLYVAGTQTDSTTRVMNGLQTIASATNPVKIIGVRTDASDTMLQTDIILGHREGNATKAYLQTGDEVPPKAIMTSSADSQLNGNLYMYGVHWEVFDNLFIGSSTAGMAVQTYEECAFVTGLAEADTFRIGTTGGDLFTRKFDFINCLFTLGAVDIDFEGYGFADFYNCEFTCTAVGTFTGSTFLGRVRFFNCDLTGCDATLVDIAGFHGGTVEFHNCRMPASHILTAGTAIGLYTVANYGSEDSTSLTTSEQAMEIHTHHGTVVLEPTIVRTGGATDLAVGLFAYTVTTNNVTDNFIGVEVPLRDIWIEGDATAKTYKVFIADNVTEGTDYQDDEVYLRLSFPSEAGLSMYDYRPDQGAPGDGGGRTQLLGTPADLTDDTTATWHASANNHQTVENSIDPDYERVVHGTLIFSRSGSDVLYVDPLPVIT